MVAPDQMPKRTALSMLVARSLIVLLAFCGVLLQASTQYAADASGLATGVWGGQGIALKVSAKGADVEFDCAHGQIAQPITLDKHGDFEVAGTFTSEHGGPMRRDETLQLAPARYSGHVDGDTMSLTVSPDKRQVGSYTLTRGSPGHITRCL
jgi:hypothetical protein